MHKIERLPDLVETVKNSIFEGILTGELRPGDKLTQGNLAKKLGVSRQPVSHAMRLLMEQGILSHLDARSLTVAEPDTRSVIQMLELRKELDGFAAYTAAKKFTSKNTADSDQALVAQIKSLVEYNLANTSRSMKQSILDDIRFHELIRDLSGNPYIHESLARYVLHHNRFISLMAKDMDQEIWRHHENILNAIIKGEEENARKFMREHIEYGTLKLKRHSDI